MIVMLSSRITDFFRIIEIELKFAKTKMSTGKTNLKCILIAIERGSRCNDETKSGMHGKGKRSMLKMNTRKYSAPSDYI